MRDTEAIIMRTVTLLRSLLTVLMLTLLGTATLRPAAASPVTVVETHEPFSSTQINPCTGELVAFQGFFHTKEHFDPTSSGTTHVSIEFNLEDVKGVGLTSGAQYIFVQAVSDTLNASGPFPFETTTEASAHMIRQGEDGALVTGDDFYVKVIRHLTINANGVVTADRFELNLDCR
jgi:hypothetical protein